MANAVGPFQTLVNTSPRQPQVGTPVLDRLKEHGLVAQRYPTDRTDTSGSIDFDSGRLWILPQATGITRMHGPADSTMSCLTGPASRPACLYGCRAA